MPDPEPTVSYRAVFAVPQLGRVVASMQLARVAQSMFGVAIVLFALAEYHSPSLAGIVTFASIFPGLLIAPIAGALLDRHGRVRLMAFDYAVAFVSLGLIGGLSLAGLLPVALLVLIVIVTSLTSILSIVGLRTIFPLMVPRTCGSGPTPSMRTGTSSRRSWARRSPPAWSRSWAPPRR